MIAVAALLSACASSPPATPAASAPAAAPIGQTKHKWSMATETEVAAELDRKFEQAAKSFVKLKKDDQIMYCKRYKEMGSMIRTLHCITEAELRKQVEDSDAARDRMRQTMGKCNIAPGVGCSAGQ
jgi:Skp family chaperone for outer membrane proteins